MATVRRARPGATRWLALLLLLCCLSPGTAAANSRDQKWKTLETPHFRIHYYNDMAPIARRVAEVIRTRTRDEWMKVFDGTDACVAPVLSMDEAPKHPHNAERKTFVEAFGVIQPSPAPRFSRTAGAVNGVPALAGKQSEDVLKSWGLGVEQAAGFLKSGAVVQA